MLLVGFSRTQPEGYQSSPNCLRHNSEAYVGFLQSGHFQTVKRAKCAVESSGLPPLRLRQRPSHPESPRGELEETAAASITASHPLLLSSAWHGVLRFPQVPSLVVASLDRCFRQPLHLPLPSPALGSRPKCVDVQPGCLGQRRLLVRPTASYGGGDLALG